MQILAIDQGTTSTRALLVKDQDNQGNVEVRCSLRHQQHRPHDGWVEHDPIELLSNIERCLESADQVDAIGLANQGESCLAWDADTGQPLSPVIVWQDNRTVPEIEVFNREGVAPMVRELSGLPLDAYFSASKLGWVVEHLPAVRKAYDSGRLRLGTTDAFFLSQLTGNHVTDVTTASRTSLMNLSTCQWDEDLCRLFGVPIEALPTICPSAAHHGTIGKVPVTASLVDQQASLYGHGCRQSGEAKITFGTGAFALAVTEDRIINDASTGVVATVAWQTDGVPVYAMEGGVYDASAAVEWAHRLGLFEKHSELAQFVAPPAIERQLIFVPALSGLACPHWDRGAGALWLGMHGGTTRQDLCQAMLEGIALRSAEVIRAMDEHLSIDGRLSIDGGLSRSPYFAQFLANVLQREIVTQRFDELTALGCASMAAKGIGKELPALQNTRRIFTPTVTTTVALGWQTRFAEAIKRSANWKS